MQETFIYIRETWRASALNMPNMPYSNLFVETFNTDLDLEAIWNQQHMLPQWFLWHTQCEAKMTKKYSIPKVLS